MLSSNLYSLSYTVLRLWSLGHWDSYGVSIPYTCSNNKLKLLLSVLYSPWALVTWSLGFLVFLSLILVVVLSSNFYSLSSTVLGLWALGHWDSYSVSIPYACSNTKLKLLLPVFYSLWALVTWSLEFLVFLSLILLVVLSSKFYYLSSTVLGLWALGHWDSLCFYPL